MIGSVKRESLAAMIYALVIVVDPPGKPAGAALMAEVSSVSPGSFAEPGTVENS